MSPLESPQEAQKAPTPQGVEERREVSDVPEAPVEVVASYRTYNLRASALENLLHRVFAEVQLDVTQGDRKGRSYDPSEWYVVPRKVIDQTIDLIISGDIVNIEYDPSTERLVGR